MSIKSVQGRRTTNAARIKSTVYYRTVLLDVWFQPPEFNSKIWRLVRLCRSYD